MTTGNFYLITSGGFAHLQLFSYSTGKFQVIPFCPPPTTSIYLQDKW